MNISINVPDIKYIISGTFIYLKKYLNKTIMSITSLFKCKLLSDVELLKPTSGVLQVISSKTCTDDTTLKFKFKAYKNRITQCHNSSKHQKISDLFGPNTILALDKKYNISPRPIMVIKFFQTTIMGTEVEQREMSTPLAA